MEEPTPYFSGSAARVRPSASLSARLSAHTASQSSVRVMAHSTMKPLLKSSGVRQSAMSQRGYSALHTNVSQRSAAPVMRPLSVASSGSSSSSQSRPHGLRARSHADARVQPRMEGNWGPPQSGPPSTTVIASTTPLSSSTLQAQPTASLVPSASSSALPSSATTVLATCAKAPAPTATTILESLTEGMQSKVHTSTQRWTGQPPTSVSLEKADVPMPGRMESIMRRDLESSCAKQKNSNRERPCSPVMKPSTRGKTLSIWRPQAPLSKALAPSSPACGRPAPFKTVEAVQPIENGCTCSSLDGMTHFAHSSKIEATKQGVDSERPSSQESRCGLPVSVPATETDITQPIPAGRNHHSKSIASPPFQSHSKSSSPTP